MKKALITGITGQDGAYLAENLLARDYTVYGTYRRTSSVNFWVYSGLPSSWATSVAARPSAPARLVPNSSDRCEVISRTAGRPPRRWWSPWRCWPSCRRFWR